MKAVFPGLASLAMLASCNSAPVQPRPGLWEWTNDMKILDVQGVPEPMASQMRSRTPPVQPPEHECITPEEAAQDISKLTDIRSDKSCRFSEIKSAAGSFSGTAECGQPGEPIQGKGKLSGTVAPERIVIDIEMATTMAMPGAGSGTVRMKMTRTGRRIGECPAGAAKP